MIIFSWVNSPFKLKILPTNMIVESRKDYKGSIAARFTQTKLTN